MPNFCHHFIALISKLFDDRTLSQKQDFISMEIIETNISAENITEICTSTNEQISEKNAEPIKQPEEPFKRPKISKDNRLSLSCETIDSLSTLGDASKTQNDRNTRPREELEGSYEVLNNNNKRLTVRKSLTWSFFFVGAFFMTVALPTSIFNAMGSWYFIISQELSDTYIVGLWISQTFYGLVFLINPCLYAASNSYVRGRIRFIFSGCKRSRGESEV